MEQNEYFIKVISGKGKSKNLYRIQTIWNNTNDNFTITILDKNNAFQSSLSKTILTKQATKYEMECEEYINKIRLCLSQSTSLDYTYSIKDNMFLISRIENKFIVQFADFNLEKIDFNEANASFIDKLMECNNDFQKKLLVYKEKTEAAINEKNCYLDKLEHYVKEKKTMENELYSKFILLLNEKKMRIQYLTELLVNYNKDMAGMETELESKITSLRNKEIISDSESDTEDETTTEKVVHEVQIEVIPEKNFLEYDTEEIPLESLPKRCKINKNNEQKTVSTKISSQENNMEDIADATETQDVLEFNTQDLFDRL